MFVEVIVDINHKQVDQLFTYRVPKFLEQQVTVGQRVIIPFGRQTKVGYVIRCVERLDDAQFNDPSKIKSIQALMDYEQVLTNELIELSRWMADTYITTRIGAIESMLPSALKVKYERLIFMNPEHEVQMNLFSDALKDKFNASGHSGFKLSSIPLDSQLFKEIQQLLDEGVLIQESDIAQSLNKKKSLSVQYIEQNIERLKGQKQIECYELIKSRPFDWWTYSDLKSHGFSRSVVKGLVDKQFLEEGYVEVARDPFAHMDVLPTEKKQLNGEQQIVFDRISNDIVESKQQVHLLHGVTGSGKTEVYLNLIEQALSLGKEAIMLVPEISLTPQMVERVKARFQDDVAVLHSALSAGEKYDEWSKINKGIAKVSVGARSSIFAPFKELGIIIMDEEHESTYKQQDHPRYAALDIAIERSKYHDIPIVLGSATPRLETYVRAEHDVYTLNTLTTRANQQATLPDIHLIDLTKEFTVDPQMLFTNPLLNSIKETLQKGEQCVLFLNRRGYSTHITCNECGHVPHCKHCDISLTYHHHSQSLKCHYCNYEENKPHQCPSCHAQNSMELIGVGTERAAETLGELIPEAQIVRMDNDTTRKKGAHERIFNQFGQGEYNVLIGTQMVAKGLDFPNVTFVGVLNADTQLNLPDFRASEHTFQLLTQVSGRAGRADKAGQVYIQTFNPTHYAIKHVVSKDYLAFYQEEMAYRKMAKYPPYFYMTLIVIEHDDMDVTLQHAHYIYQFIDQQMNKGCYLLGPTPSPVSKVKDKYRYQLLIKYKQQNQMNHILHQIDQQYRSLYQTDRIAVHIYINPDHFM